MTELEAYYKRRTGDKLICVKLIEGTVKRIKQRDAYKLVKEGIADYCPKSEWKAQKPVKKAKKVKPKKATIHGLKAKERKK